MQTIKKTIVYSFYVCDGWKDKETNRIHFECLKNYSSVFDNAIICLVIDNVNNNETISAVEKFFIDIFDSESITFKVVQNGTFREGAVFYNEIASKLDKIDGLVFFAHNKGITNVDDGYDKGSIYKWITSMYFLSLQYEEEAVRKLTDERYFSYGSLLDYVNAEDKESTPFLDMGKRNFMYTGTFFWVNAGTLRDYLIKSGTTVPKLTDRWYAENFMANIAPFKCCTAHNGKYAVDYIGGRKFIKYLIERILTDDYRYDFYKFNDYILKMANIA